MERQAEGISISAQLHLNYWHSTGSQTAERSALVPKQAAVPSRIFLSGQASTIHWDIGSNLSFTNQQGQNSSVQVGLCRTNNLQLLEAKSGERGPHPSHQQGSPLQRHQMTKQPTSQTSLVTMPEGKERKYHIGLCALAK